MILSKYTLFLCFGSASGFGSGFRHLAESRSAIKDIGNSNTGSLAFLNVSVSNSLNPDLDPGFLLNPDKPILLYISSLTSTKNFLTPRKFNRSPDRT
jgi:hypothetical protein